MSAITYDQFLAGVQELHLNLIATFVTGARVKLLKDDTKVESYRNVCRDLYNYQLADRVAEGYERVGDQEWITWDVYVNDTGRGYANKLTVERIKLSRAPMPA